jgi:transaldolase
MLGRGPHRLFLGGASTTTKDPSASDTLYVEALAAPDTIDTMPEKTLHAFADHGKVRGPSLPMAAMLQKCLLNSGGLA